MTTTCLKLQAMTFMTLVHYRYNCAHGKGKNNPKNIGERLKSAEKPAKGHHKKVPGARGRADTIWVTHSRYVGAGRGAEPAPVAARRKVRAAGWEARAELLKWSKSKAWRG